MLARFRADPARIRVSLRHYPSGWIAVVAVRDSAILAYQSALHTYAADAIEQALIGAARATFPGIDLGCDWAYDHPQLPETGGKEASNA